MIRDMTWTEYIKADLKSRICEGDGLPPNLTLQGLSSSYQVSHTPVRVAVRDLVAEGILVRRDNGRLAVNPDRPEIASKGLTLKKPKSPKNYLNVIAKDLVRESLQGVEIELREDDMAQKYGVSGTVVREIFHRLAGVGIVKHLPRRGWRLRPFSEERLKSFIDIRVVLELYALEAAMPRLVPEDLKRMHDSNWLPDGPDDMPVVDTSLHQYIIDKANNPYISDFFRNQGLYFQVLTAYEYTHPSIREVAITAVKQHRKILRALLDGDIAAAKFALEEDIRADHPAMRLGAQQHRDNGSH